MLRSRFAWLRAAAALLACALVLPALGQDGPKEPAPDRPQKRPQKRPKDAAPEGAQQRLGPSSADPSQQRLKDRPTDGIRQGLAPQGGSRTFESYEPLRLFGQVLDTLEKQYVGHPDRTRLIEGAIGGMLKQLDAKAQYYDAQEYRELQIGRPNRAGLGLEFRIDGSRVAVVAALADTPAERAGVGSGDVLTHIDGVELNGLTLRQVRDLLTGPPGSKTVLTIERGRPAQVLEIPMQREMISLPAVKSSAEGEIGYLRIASFRDGTDLQLAKAVSALMAQIGSRLKGFVLDLRNNTGGLLNQAVLCADAFLESGLIVELRGREDTKQHRARPGDLARGLPLIVLVNGGTASGAEIVAAALQEHKRARLVGARTAGSGTIQTIFPLTGPPTPTGSPKFGGYGAISVTTHHHYTPSGRALEGNGLEPDVMVAPAGGGEGPAGLVPQDKTADAQLQRALALLRDGA